MVARTQDGGVTWDFVSWIGPEPAGFAIMPSTVRLSSREFLTTLRCREGTFRWLEQWRSVDGAKTWTKEANPVDYLGEGNPPMLNQLPNGYLCLTYGFRAYPFSIRARLSTDSGATWGPEIILRNDGKVVTTYYISDEKTGPERYIGATIWDPMNVAEITSGEVERQLGF